ncbi:NAD(P)-dependent alcohol dehydrogenase [Planctomycetaceae bacterium SH139]
MSQVSNRERVTHKRSIPTMMTAITYADYGGPEVLVAGARSTPPPSSGGVLIRVHCASVNPVDARLRKGEMRGLLPGGFPRVPGFDVAGEVVAVGPRSHRQVGDRVLAFLDNFYGGGCAEYAACGDQATAVLPDSMSYKHAAALPLAGCTALQSLRDHGKMKPGSHVLINGASGGVGAFAVQIAVAWGARVDAVASGENEEFCRSLGARNFFDYRQTKFTDSDRRWDLIFDAAGKTNFHECRGVLTREGRYVSTEPNFSGLLTAVLTFPFAKQGRVMLAKPRQADLATLVDLHVSGKLNVYIDSLMDLSQAATAHRRIEAGVERGKIVLRNDLAGKCPPPLG